MAQKDNKSSVKSASKSFEKQWQSSSKHNTSKASAASTSGETEDGYERRCGLLGGACY